jgi:cation diffusion facilitator family transporter
VPSQASQGVVTVVVALVANLGVALAKVVAALLTRSSAMLAEAVHAFADSGNEILLLIAQRRSERPADQEHPMGHGREAYFWALLASVVAFVAGALLSIREGVEGLMHPTAGTSFGTAYAVLIISFGLEAWSLRRAYRQLRKEASTLGREFIEHLDLSSDPIARAVFAEDSAAVGGNVVAAIGIALHQLTGSPIPDAIAAVVIGLTLGYVAVQLARRNGDFLIGRQAPEEVRTRVQEVIASQVGICVVRELLITFLGPRRLWVLARIDVNDSLSGAELKALLGAIEQLLRSESPAITRIDLVPTSQG